VNTVETKTNGGQPPSKAGDPNAQIAMKLRAFYHSVQDEALPQRFLDLLEKLDAAEGGVRRAE